MCLSLRNYRRSRFRQAHKRSKTKSWCCVFKLINQGKVEDSSILKRVKAAACAFPSNQRQTNGRHSLLESGGCQYGSGPLVKSCFRKLRISGGPVRDGNPAGVNWRNNDLRVDFPGLVLRRRSKVRDRSYFAPLSFRRYSATACAAARPSEIAQTTSDCPRRISPAANTPGTELI
jgi:hypothetical protein